MGVVGLHPPIPSWDAYPLTLDYHKTASEWAFEAILARLKRWNLEIEFAPLRCAHGCCGGGHPHTPGPETSEFAPLRCAHGWFAWVAR